MTRPDLTQAVDAYLESLRGERQLALHTVTNYRRDLNKLTRYIEQQGLGDWRKLSPAIARQFPARLHAAGLSGKSIQRVLSAARGLFGYLVELREVRNNPFADVRAPRASRRLPDTLNVDEIEQLLAAMAGDALAERDRAMVELIYSGGLRLSETIALDVVDVTRGTTMISVTGKGRKQRLVPVGRKARSAISSWLLRRPALAAEAETALFVSSRGSRMSARSVQARLDVWARRSGLNRKLHPHMLRHSFASHMLESSGDLRAVQELLGHANISTTQVYTHLDFQHLAKVYDLAHPRARRRSGSKD